MRSKLVENGVDLSKLRDEKQRSYVVIVWTSLGSIFQIADEFVFFADFAAGGEVRVGGGRGQPKCSEGGPCKVPKDAKEVCRITSRKSPWGVTIVTGARHVKRFSQPDQVCEGSCRMGTRHDVHISLSLLCHLATAETSSAPAV